MNAMRLVIIPLISGIAVSCASTPKDLELKYAGDINSAKRYELSYNQDSKAEMNGEPMTAQYLVKLPYDVEFSQNQGTVNARITLDSPEVKTILANGQQILDTRNLRDFELVFVYNEKGMEKKVNYLQDSLSIDFGEMLGGRLDWEYLFSYVTPSLPSKTVNIGDNWEENLSVERIEAGSKVNANLVFTHTLSDFQKVGGRKCAVISSKIGSSLDDNYSMMGASWNLVGELKGSMKTYLDYEAGIIIKLTIDESSSGKVNAAGIGINASYDQNSRIELNLIDETDAQE